ncbi:MAG: hypothetical protein K6A36_04170 [Paludibacteraceae bacterium]|nr:hypothetical protein [Paludibacteraceae bacterium]
MEELIKYFEKIEARLSAIEQTQRALIEKQNVNDNAIQTINEHIGQINSAIEELKNQCKYSEQMQANSVLDIPVFPAVAVQPKVEEAKPEVVAAPQPEPQQVATPQPAPQPQPQVAETVTPTATPVAAAQPAAPNANSALYGKPVNDIRLAISLGDRFLYQRELFGQNAELMQRTLSELDNLGSFDEAMNYISQFGWDPESSTYQQFLITLHRRFG